LFNADATTSKDTNVSITLAGLSEFQKDKNTLMGNKNVIFKVFCKDCNASYVGQTKRKLRH